MNLGNLNRSTFISMKVMLPQDNRSTSKKQNELNQEKWSNSKWIYFTQSSSFEDIQLTDQYFTISTKDSFGTLEIDDQKYTVESKLYLSLYYDQNDIKIKSSSDNVSFKMFLKEIITNNESNSISDIYILTKGKFYDIPASLFIIISMLL